MKKYVLITTVIALLAVAVFGGRAMAFWWDWEDYFPTPTPTPTPTCAGVCMETLSGIFTVEDQDDMIVEYPGVRHVSLSLYAEEAFDQGDYARLYMYFGNGTSTWRVRIADLDPNITNTYEFAAQKWQIGAGNTNGALPIQIIYRATITYPSNQW
jgi:hypothetical protein